MTISKNPAVTRFAQLNAGDLFIFDHNGGSAVALTVRDPTVGGDLLALIIGPSFPDGGTVPTLRILDATTVISFGRNYTIRLPVHPDGWRTAAPSPELHAIAVSDSAELHFRAAFGTSKDSKPCYIDLQRAQITVDHSAINYVPPKGYSAYAVAWEILTKEEAPRSILSYPS